VNTHDACIYLPFFVSVASQDGRPRQPSLRRQGIAYLMRGMVDATVLSLEGDSFDMVALNSVVLFIISELGIGVANYFDVSVDGVLNANDLHLPPCNSIVLLQADQSQLSPNLHTPPPFQFR